MSSKKNETRKRILESTWSLMEQHSGQSISMSRIAKEAGISRQALYLHFASRVELVTATVHYVDEVKGLNQRLKTFETATTGEQLLEACVDVWGNYIPEIYGVAKALLNTRDTDEASATAWAGCMLGLRDVSERAIVTLEKEGKLDAKWSQREAIDMFLTIISIHNWEQLTIECGWSNEEYIAWIKVVLKRTFIAGNN